MNFHFVFGATDEDTANSDSSFLQSTAFVRSGFSWADPITALPSSGSDSLSSSSSSLTSVDPRDYGADPTGNTDSTPAFDKALAALFNTSALAPKQMASNITDFGGATLDLNGGVYLISAPVLVPLLAGNVRITGGTLRAASSFPKDRYLIEVGSADCNPTGTPSVFTYP